MPAAGTDVREWLRSQGEKVGTRGQIRQELIDKYNTAHGLPPDAAAGSYDAGVAEADFPEPDNGTTSDQGGKQEPAAAERRPRTVKGTRGPRFTDRVFKRPAAGGRRRPRQPRVDLSDFAEETWLDLAWLAQPIPPLAKIFTIQAPYAGAVLDEQVKGTIVDAALQPLARYSGVYRALNGLLGPPVCVLAICAQGRRDPKTGEYDMATQMMFGMLRYCLLQMARVSDLRADQIAERTEDMAARMAVVDKIIEDLFTMPGPGQRPPAGDDVSRETPAGAPVTGTVVHRPRTAENGYPYPESPEMDGTGADPGRS